MSTRRVVAAVVAAALVGPLTAAGGPAGGAPGGPAPAVVAQTVPGDAWSVESPESHGIDPTLLDGARAYAFEPERNTQGVVVVHEGAIVAEWYDEGAGPDSWAASWSVAKSFTSALVGIAIEQGHIPSIDEPMTTWYPEWVGTPKAAITLRHVLHMESGLDWDESYDPSDLESSEIIAMVAASPDQLAYAASRPLEVAPGTRFNYSSGDTMLLAGVIQRATGKLAADYAREVLLDPIGIEQFDWWQDAEAHTLGYCCVDTTSRNFARFGLLYLRGGSWGGDQVVPASWVDASVTDTAASYDGYGYQWWLDEASGGLPAYYSARGHDGQYIYVIPSLDLVVVRNGFYGKSTCPSIADPNLVGYYPPQGLVPGWGTLPPSDWSDTAFLEPIVAAVTGVLQPDGAPAGATTAAAPTDPVTQAPPPVCANVAPVAAPTTPPPAVAAAPRFTG